MPVHLEEGSSEPPLKSGVLRLYGMRFCPYDERVHLVLRAKNITYDPVFINLKSKPDWFLKRSKSGKVPALVVDDGDTLYESLIVADYLDEKFPGRNLHSKDPLKKAKDRILIENFGKVFSIFYKLVFDPHPTVEHFEALVAELSLYDTELAQRGTLFFGGSEPGMVDYMIWPFCERIPSLKGVLGDCYELPKENLKNLSEWMEKMLQDDTVASYALTKDIHAKFIKSSVLKTPDYNLDVGPDTYKSLHK